MQIDMENNRQIFLALRVFMKPDIKDDFLEY